MGKKKSHGEQGHVGRTLHWALHWAVHLGASRDEDVEGKEEVPSRGTWKGPPPPQCLQAPGQGQAEGEAEGLATGWASLRVEVMFL